MGVGAAAASVTALDFAAERIAGASLALGVKPARVSRQSSVPVFLPVSRADFDFLEMHPLYEMAKWLSVDRVASTMCAAPFPFCRGVGGGVAG